MEDELSQWWVVAIDNLQGWKEWWWEEMVGGGSKGSWRDRIVMVHVMGRGCCWCCFLTAQAREGELYALLLKAKHEFLSGVELSKLISNHEEVGMDVRTEEIKKPIIYLFDRTKLKHFRKDGHKWTKKDGKGVKESHGYLQAGGTELRYYYGRAEENSDFQRRIYWFSTGPSAHIALVHYLIKGRKGDETEQPAKHNEKKQSTKIFVKELSQKLLSGQDIVVEDVLVNTEKPEHLVEAFAFSQSIQKRQQAEQAEEETAEEETVQKRLQAEQAEEETVQKRQQTEQAEEETVSDA